MHEQESFNWINLIPGVEHLPNHVVHAALVAGLMIITMGLARFSLNRELKKEHAGIIPPATLTYRNFFEILAEKLYGLCEQVMGPHEAKIFYPFIGTLFCFIFFANLIGAIPGFTPPTENLNTTLAFGAFVFLYYNIQGIIAQGPLGHIKHFFGPTLSWSLCWLAPLMFVIEIVSHVFRPVSLGLRLRGNIMGDHVVHGVFSNLVPIGLPVIFLGLGVFVAFIQAFVFSLMTMVYISLSTAQDH
ncbi:MAG: F0F1 ATP synthase subunit A [Bdellovibrionales bacterium]|nr:F0F1 ATP synthase subunit A [Bdellovibrionales bacterium]